jgi:hypothetical protein
MIKSRVEKHIHLLGMHGIKYVKKCNQDNDRDEAFSAKLERVA